jgi:dsRNA-specific ribonuclease
MDPKAKRQLVKAAKSFTAIIAALFYEEGVRFLRNTAHEWLEARAKKAKTAKPRARRKKS